MGNNFKRINIQKLARVPFSKSLESKQESIHLEPHVFVNLVRFNLSDFQQMKRTIEIQSCFKTLKKGILHERASIALGRFVSDCGRMCGLFAGFPQ